MLNSFLFSFLFHGFYTDSCCLHSYAKIFSTEVITTDIFVSPTKGKLSLDQVVEEIVNYLNEDEQSEYRLVIGSDSHNRYLHESKYTNFISAVVVHRVGKGGRYFWKNGTHTVTHSLRDKIYQETVLSLELASVMVPVLKKHLENNTNWNLEIHIDVGHNGETRKMLKEVVGMVIGSGYSVKTKPDSFAASSIADKHT